MFCPKCGEEIPDDSVQCPSCDAKISGEAPAAGPGALSMLSMLIKADPTGFLTLVGSFFIILGAFLPWVAGTGYYSSALGVEAAQGAVILLLGVLFLATLVLSRTGATGAWGVVTVLLSFLALALIFQSLYYIKDNDASTGAGLWLAMVGVFVVTAAALLQQFGTAKK